MYTLTLSRLERAAIDWVGDRYGHGRGLYALLVGCHDGATDWDDDEDITYLIPEHVAWLIKDICDAGDLACFAPALRKKLCKCCDSIV